MFNKEKNNKYLISKKISIKCLKKKTTYKKLNRI